MDTVNADRGSMIVGEQQLLPIVMQAKSIVESNIRLINCWAGIARWDNLDNSAFCITCYNIGICKRLYKLFAGIERPHPSLLARQLCKLFNVESEYMRSNADLDTYYAVLSRDINKDGVVTCIRCGSPAVDVHEIMPKSWYGKRRDRECFAISNRCCLCRKCHKEVVSDMGRGELLLIMSNKHGYKYEDDHRRWLIENYKRNTQKK